MRKTSDHYFFRLSDPKCVEFLKSWLDTPGRLQPSVANKAREWLSGSGDQELSDWDISRDAPYFGIPIPDAPGKYFYVWLDAPIGYLASLKNYFDSGKARANGEPRSFEEFLAAPDDRADPLHRQGHHLLPHAVLAGDAASSPAARCPTTSTCTASSRCRGAKMSKSRGTGISPLRYLELGMNPEWLRYYIAAKLNANVEDIDFNPEDFVARVNSDLVGKYVNIASRSAGFISKRFGGTPRCSWIRCARADQGLSQRRAGRADRCALRRARVRQGDARDHGVLLDRVNQYIDANKPWELAKDRRRAAAAARGLLHEPQLVLVPDRTAAAGAAGDGAQGRKRCCG